MCRKFVLVSSPEKIASRFRVSPTVAGESLPAAYGVSGGDATYVLTMERPQELQAMRFGMTPYWAKSPMDLINARAEGDKNPGNDPCYGGARQIFLKRAFMKPLQSQRCLVPADAYYEWTGAKKPYLVYLQDKQRPFAMAGLYDYWQHPQTREIMATFTIITTTANMLLQSIGIKRMPVILKPGYEREWLKADRSLSQVLGMLEGYTPQKMNAYPVGGMVNTAGANDPAMILPVGGKLQSEAAPVKVMSRYGQYPQKKKMSGEGSWGERRMNKEGG